jgi:hypothetical protein
MEFRSVIARANLEPLPTRAVGVTPVAQSLGHIKPTSSKFARFALWAPAPGQTLTQTVGQMLVVNTQADWIRLRTSIIGNPSTVGYYKQDCPLGKDHPFDVQKITEDDLADSLLYRVSGDSFSLSSVVCVFFSVGLGRLNKQNAHKLDVQNLFDYLHDHFVQWSPEANFVPSKEDAPYSWAKKGQTSQNPLGLDEG